MPNRTKQHTEMTYTGWIVCSRTVTPWIQSGSTPTPLTLPSDAIGVTIAPVPGSSDVTVYWLQPVTVYWLQPVPES